MAGIKVKVKVEIANQDALDALVECGEIAFELKEGERLDAAAAGTRLCELLEVVAYGIGVGFKR